MASLGLFGSSAPRMRARMLQPPQISPMDEMQLLKQQEAASQQAALAAAARGEDRRRGLIGATPEAIPATDPAGSPPQEAKTPPLGMFGSGAPKAGKYQNAGQYQPGQRDWWKEISSDPFGFLLTGSEGLSQKRDEAMAYSAQQAAIEERARKEAELVAQARAAGLDPGGVLAMSLNPTEFGKSYSTNYEAANVAGGDSRSVFENGKRTMITAPKFGVDGGRGYTQTAEGTEWGDQRGKSYEEITNEGKLAEDVRNNNLTNSRGWATIGIERDKAAKAGLPDFGDENSFRNQYLGQAKPYQDVKAAAGRVATLSADMNPAEQMALVFSTMKMLDPGSTVREGEYATAQNTTGIAGQAWNYYNKMQNGEFLNPTQIKEFRDMIGGLEREAEKSYVQTLDQYRSMAPRYRMDPSIIQDFRGPGAGPTPREQAAAASREVAARAGHAGGVMGGKGQFDPAAFANLRPSNDVSDLLDKYR